MNPYSILLHCGSIAYLFKWVNGPNRHRVSNASLNTWCQPPPLQLTDRHCYCFFLLMLILLLENDWYNSSNRSPFNLKLPKMPLSSIDLETHNTKSRETVLISSITSHLKTFKFWQNVGFTIWRLLDLVGIRLVRNFLKIFLMTPLGIQTHVFA